MKTKSAAEPSATGIILISVSYDSMCVNVVVRAGDQVSMGAPSHVLATISFLIWHRLDPVLRGVRLRNTSALSFGVS